MEHKSEKLTLEEVQERFPAEASCEDLIVQSRWPFGVVCHHCKTVGRSAPLPSRRRTWFCGACRRQFSILAGTPMYRTHLPLKTWIMAMFLQTASSKGVSSVKMAEWLGVCLDTAWYLERRIDKMMEALPGMRLTGPVEVDEKTTAGKPRADNIPQSPPSAPLFEAAGLAEPPPLQKHKAPGKPGPRPGHDCGSFLTMASRDGQVITVPIDRATVAEVAPHVDRWIDPSALLITDDLGIYPKIGARFAGHLTVNHGAGEYGRYEKGFCVHTNTAESFHALVERMIVGVYHRISPKHRHFYLSQAAFRWSTRKLGTVGRLAEMFRRASGRVMTYKILTAPALHA